MEEGHNCSTSIVAVLEKNENKLKKMKREIKSPKQ
jgi:hypothetical protein